jgi:two-component sensor histidine kinase
VVLTATRDGDDLEVRVCDDGRGLPSGFDPAASTGLGLQIVRTLVTSELHGTLVMGPPEGGGRGTEAVLVLPAAGRPRR